MVDQNAEIVGPITGPVSTTIEAQATGGKYINSGAMYDFAIGSLPFVRWSTDEYPYARETGQIRKDQFDSAPQPGDQSLSGSWLRGQLTFHRGEGVKYYEVLQGEDILNRYSTGEGVNPWTPGELRLRQEVELFDSSDYVQGVMGYSYDLSKDTAFLLTEQGQVKRVNSDATGVATLQDSDGNTTGFESLAANDVFMWAVRNGDVYIKNGTDTFTKHFEHASTNQFVKCFFAKDRLWLVDDTARWYALAPYVSDLAVADTAAFWQGQPTTNQHNWKLIDTPGGVVICDQTKVYIVSLDTSGAVPTLTSPTVATILPPRERIYSVTWHMGYLVLGTNRGMRVAQMQQDNVTLGPLFDKVMPSKDGDLCPDGSFVSFVGKGEDDEEDSSWEFNLAEFVTDLIPAYCRVRTLQSPLTGVLRVGPREFTYGALGAWVTTPGVREPSGHLYIGFQRFGTLEPKVFQSVSIRAEGDDGSLAIWLVRKDGTERPLVTLAPDQFKDFDIPFNMEGPDEYIGLKIELRRGVDTSKTPTLLGYQIKALPAPKRQRMIQVPFSCHDIENVAGVTRGHQGWAWQRLAALEDLEKSSGLLTYQDFTTGEQRQVYIETLQFQVKTPASKGDTGFGGIGVITMRAVD